MDLVCIMEPNLQVEQTTGKVWVGSLSSFYRYTSGYRTQSGSKHGKQFTMDVNVTRIEGTENIRNILYFSNP